MYDRVCNGGATLDETCVGLERKSFRAEGTGMGSGCVPRRPKLTGGKYESEGLAMYSKNSISGVRGNTKSQIWEWVGSSGFR